jgi:hypothetical protein
LILAAALSFNFLDCAQDAGSPKKFDPTTARPVDWSQFRPIGFQMTSSTKGHFIGTSMLIVTI